jgi:hypothetical protein
MEHLPKNPEQMRFEKGPESIKVGDFLTYIRESENKGYFLDQSGFRIETIPVGTRIKTSGFGIALSINMPESEGLVVFVDGQTLFNLETGFQKKHQQLSKFFDGDIIEIISLP